MEITLNGKTRDIQDGISVQELLDQMRIDCMQVVVEHKQLIIPRQRLAETFLSNGDSLEVIHFVGGG